MDLVYWSQIANYLTAKGGGREINMNNFGINIFGLQKETEEDHSLILMTVLENISILKKLFSLLTSSPSLYLECLVENQWAEPN